VSWRRIRAIVVRHAFVLWRSPHRWFDVVVWPVVDTVLFGSLGVLVAREADAQTTAAAALLAGITLFHVVYQSEISVAVGFLEEIWSRQLLNLMVTPLREIEYVAGVALFGLVKLAIGMAVVCLTAWAAYAFAITDVGWGLLPIAGLLLLIGWTISLFVIGLVLRFGPGAEVLAWGIMFVVMPLSGIFYPVDALPGALQPVARVLPTTQLFDAARRLIDGEATPWGQIAVGALGTLITAAIGLWFLLRMLSVFRQRGYITRFS
jgi:ABC-2 type transport system permease protein